MKTFWQTKCNNPTVLLLKYGKLFPQMFIYCQKFGAEQTEICFLACNPGSLILAKGSGFYMNGFSSTNSENGCAVTFFDRMCCCWKTHGIHILLDQGPPVLF